MPHWPWLCITPSVPFVPSSGLSNFTLSTSEELNKTAVKPIRHEWRWQVKSFFFFFTALSCFPCSELPLLHYSLSLMLFCPNKGSAGGSELSSPAGCKAVGSCYYPGAGWPWRGRRPLLRSQLHLHSSSLTSPMLHFHSLFTSAYPTSKVRPCTERRRLPFISFVLFHVLHLFRSFLNLLRTLGLYHKTTKTKGRDLSK